VWRLSPNSILRALAANIGLKVVSLLLAICLWLYVTAQIGEKQTFSVPLAMVNVPDSLAVAREAPREIAITMRSSRSEILKLRFMSTVRATVDLAGAREGRVMVSLTPGNLNLPGGFRPEDVTIESPKSLTLDLERVVSVSVPVTPVLRGVVPKEMMLVGEPSVTPDHVIVRGPASAMRGVVSVETEPIDLHGRRGKLSREVPLRVPRGRQAVPDKVLVELEVSRRAVRTIPGITPTVFPGEEGLDIEFSPTTAALTVEGPEELVSKLVPDDVSIILSVAPGTRGTTRIQPEVIVPQGIDTFTLDVSSFEVRVLPAR
jgi:YbbR domain-containing protein